MEYLSVSQKKRREIIEKIKSAFSDKKEIRFAFIFGSFLDSPNFRDIDVGVYLKSVEKNNVFDCELELSEKASSACEMPLDVLDIRILNFAPLPFLNNIFSRGELLFSEDSEFLSDLIEKSSLHAIANEHIAQQSLKELVPK